MSKEEKFFVDCINKSCPKHYVGAFYCCGKYPATSNVDMNTIKANVRKCKQAKLRERSWDHSLKN